MYDAKADYIKTRDGGPFVPTQDDPLCAGCGWPKHHHGVGTDPRTGQLTGGTGPLVFDRTEDRCEQFKGALGVGDQPAQTRGRRSEQ